MNLADEAKRRSPIPSASEVSADVKAEVIGEKNWAHSVDQCRLYALQFLVHLISLLSILLRYNGFVGIQKAVVD